MTDTDTVLTLRWVNVGLALLLGGVLGFALVQFGMRVGMMYVTRVRWLALDLVGLVLSGLWVAWAGWGGPFTGV